MTADIMVKFPLTFSIDENNFANAWSRMIHNVIRSGRNIIIGNKKEPKPIRDICGIVSLYGDAISQIENRELHPQFPFKFVNTYCEQFTRKYQKEYKLKPEDEQFTYTYFDRFMNYESSRNGYNLIIDQLDLLKTKLSTQINDNISSNRNQMITWNVGIDTYSEAAPCLQQIWLRYLGDRKIEVHWHFRSRDLFTAWQANIIGLTYMLNKEVIYPNACKIIKIVDYSDSLHIYASDLEAAKKVKNLPISPMLKR